MIDLEAKVLSEMATLEINIFIKDDLRELIIEGEYEMAFKLASDEAWRVHNAMPEYRITKPFEIINAINQSEERRKQEHNKQFRFEHYDKFN